MVKAQGMSCACIFDSMLHTKSPSLNGWIFNYVYPLDLMIMALCCSFTLDLSITAERTFVPVAGFCGTDIKIILIASLESVPTYLKAVCRSSSSLITMVALMPQLVKCTLFSVLG